MNERECPQCERAATRAGLRKRATGGLTEERAE
jgi:hypothetical protein